MAIKIWIVFFWIMTPSCSGKWLSVLRRDLGHHFYFEVRGTGRHISEGSILHLAGTFSYAVAIKMETAGFSNIDDSS
jgi:hypothetical protein